MHRKSIPVLLALVGVACSGGTSTSPTPPTTHATVAATASLAFSPGSITVAQGATVTFAFGTVAHNVFFQVATGAPADIAGSNANVNVARTFATAGTFTYQCHIHPGMTGTIVVTAANSSTGSTSGGYGA